MLENRLQANSGFVENNFSPMVLKPKENSPEYLECE